MAFFALHQAAGKVTWQISSPSVVSEEKGVSFVQFSGLRPSNQSTKAAGEAASLGKTNVKLQQRFMVRADVESPAKQVSKKTTLQLLWEEHSQSPWFDNLRRPVTFLQEKIDIGIRGVTSNPTIFQKAIAGSDLYDDQFRSLIKQGKSVDEAYWEMVVTDIRDAADLFHPLWEKSHHLDGFVSVEVSPALANDGPGTVATAKDLHAKVDLQNVYVKIPATLECVPAIEEVTAAGVSVNVTLIFSNARYADVMEAYIRGLERTEGDLATISSVASFFVSRVDSLVDKKLEALGTEEARYLQGKAAIAQCKLAYELYQRTFLGPRWEALEKRGAKPQRLLWASTGVKNPKYPDTLYIDSLIGPGTVNTMPDTVLEAFYDHGTVARSIDVDVEGARKVYDRVEELGIIWDETGVQLEKEGVASFLASFEDLMGSLGQKARALIN